MNEDELLKEIEKANKALEAYKTSLGEKADKAQIDNLTKEINALKAELKTLTEEKVGESIKTINDMLATMSKQIAEVQESVNVMKDAGNSRGITGKSFGRSVIDAIKEAGLDKKKSWSKNEHQTIEVKFDILGNIQKAVGTITTANVTPAGNAAAIPFTLTEYESGFARIVRRKPWILMIANVSRTTKKYVQWAEIVAGEGAANYTAEGVKKNQIDFDWVEKSAEVLKITAFIKVSKEALEDVDGLEAEINNELTEQILLKVDAELLTGAGTTGILSGIQANDTAYNAGSFAGTIPNANKSDVLRTAIAQVVAANFIPDYALLHPNDIASMELEKGTDGHYVMPPFRSADGTMIAGVKVIGNTGQTVDKFTVGDFTKFHVRMREDLTIDIGLENDDFTKNLRTILAEIRLVSYVKTQNVPAFVSGDFSDAIAALESGS